MSRNPRSQSARPSSRASFDCFAVAAPGLEQLVARELDALGIDNRVSIGGAAFSGGLEALVRANLWLRTGSRVLVRVAAFRAQAFHELERLARALPWERFLRPGAAVRLRVTSHKSRLYHTGGIAQRLLQAIEHRLGRPSALVGSGADDHDAEFEEAQLFVIRVAHDGFTVSADSSGALLHRRGYRQAVAKAPLRETLAAAMLLRAGWNGSTALIDPMCGSGTIPIEGALIARRIAPGLSRDFAFSRWPEVHVMVLERERERALSMALPKAPSTILGSDRDPGAIEAAAANAARANVSADVDLSVRPLSAIQAIGDVGVVATNPPYGVRVGEARRLRDLYARLGQLLRSRFAGWDLAVLSADPRLDRELKLALQEELATRNGGIAVRLLVGRVAATRAAGH